MQITKYETVFLNLILIILVFYFFNFLVENQTTIRLCCYEEV